MKVIVCDDISDRGNETISAIKEVCPSLGVDSLFSRKLSDSLQSLFEVISKILPSEGGVQAEHLQAIGKNFNCDVLIIDNNLAALDIKGARVTAENIAGYIRAFGKAVYIVSLNRNPEVDFDLRYLMGDYQTITDIALNTNHLSISRLWGVTGGQSTDGSAFRPWYWPSLPEAVERRRKQIEFVKKHLERSVLHTLSFPLTCINNLSRHAKAALWPRAADASGGDAEEMLKDVTFLDLFTVAGRSLPVAKERVCIANSVKNGDRSLLNAVASVAAAELDRWIRRDVLGPQDILVDVPHLLMRMPFLLGDRVGDIKHWNSAIATKDDYCGLDETYYRNHLLPLRFSHEIWVNSPCFWWPEVKQNKKLDDVFFDSNVKWIDALFCEDTSTFRTSSDQGLMEFATEYEEGTWNRRVVECVDGYKYSPRSRLA